MPSPKINAAQGEKCCQQTTRAGASLPYQSQPVSLHQRAANCRQYLLAHELVRGYTRSSISPRCALKIDLKKAFDSVSWRYLISLMLAFGFPLHFVLWIATCIASPYFSVVVNGSLVGYFPGAKGVRQGDALSPYLFVLTMDLLICDA